MERSRKTPGERHSQVAQQSRTCLPMQETWVRSPGREDPLEEGVATHSRVLAWMQNSLEKHVHIPKHTKLQ